MKTKLVNIKTKFILLILALVIIGSTIGILSYAIISKINMYDKILKSADLLKIHQNSFHAELANFLATDQKDIVFYKTSESNSINNFEKAAVENTKLIEGLIEDKYFAMNKDLMDMLIKIKELSQKYQDNFNYIVANTKDRGYQGYGLVGNLQNQGNKIKAQTSNIDDFMISGQIDNLVSSINKYSTNFDQATYNELLSTSNNLLYTFQNSDEIAGSVSATDIINQLNVFQNTLKLIFSKNETIGVSRNAGLRKEITVVSEETKRLIQNLSDKLAESVPDAQQNLLIWYYIIIAVLVIAICYFIISLFLGLYKPFDKISKVVLKLKQGNLTEKTDLTSGDELGMFSKNIDNVIEGLEEKAKFAKDLGNGKFESDYKLLSENDMLGNALLDLRKNLQKAAEEDKKHKIENEKRRWTNEGLAQFGEILRMNNDNIEMLCDNIIKNLVKYLNANQGGIYLHTEDEDETYLNMISIFAFDRKKFLDRKIALGEGLVGTCGVEKLTIYMTDIPEDYITITSGLGGAKPRCLLVVPLKLEDNILGVVEIASFNKLEQHEIDFVEKIAESIASTLASAKINERTAQLLEKSQKQAQEMVEQEEEMRQNMEELQATQEESARRESEMYGILHAINTASNVIEFDMDGVITEINDKFLLILETGREKLIGMHHSEFTQSNKNSPEYINFWNELKEGNAITKIQKFEASSGSEVWLRQNYTPIFNKDGLALKILCISSDITDSVKQEKEIQKQKRNLSALESDMEQLDQTIEIAFFKGEIGPKGEILETNFLLEQVLGSSKKELKSKNIRDFIADEEAKNFDRIWENIQVGTVFNSPLKFKTKEGETKLLKTILNPIMNAENILEKIIIFGQEFTKGHNRDDEDNETIKTN